MFYSLINEEFAQLSVPATILDNYHHTSTQPIKKLIITQSGADSHCSPEKVNTYQREGRKKEGEECTRHLAGSRSSFWSRGGAGWGPSWSPGCRQLCWGREWSGGRALSLLPWLTADRWGHQGRSDWDFLVVWSSSVWPLSSDKWHEKVARVTDRSFFILCLPPSDWIKKHVGGGCSTKKKKVCCLPELTGISRKFSHF